MPTPKVERLLNLVICLLSAKNYVTAEFIRANVVGYQDETRSDDAFNRMFERDKTELRDLGVPLVTGRSRMSSEHDGYRIDPDSYTLPEISLDRDEAAAVAMAAAIWEGPEVTALAQRAVLKLQAAGIDVRSDAVADVTPRSASRSMGSETVVAALLAAIDSGSAVQFDYRAGSGASHSRRTFEPWGIVTNRGRWYVVGHDLDRAATRTFRLSRLSSVEQTGESGVVTVPADVSLHDVVAAAVDGAAGSDGRVAEIWVAQGRAAGLRRIATGERDHRIDGEQGSVLEIEVRSLPTLARMVLGAGPDAVVLQPQELRDEVIGALDRVARGSVTEGADR